MKNTIEYSKVLPYHDKFSIMPLRDDKSPFFDWKLYQSEKIPLDLFKRKYKELFGLITGFEDLEVFDIDLKVFSTSTEKVDFWNEYIGLLRDNIYDFDDKFAVYKTQNAGYHIIYKSKRVQGAGNEKIAYLKGHKQAVIETRGFGGYVACYPNNKASKLSYFDVQYITDEDREILFSCSRIYDYKKPQEEVVTPKIKKEFVEGNETPPWTDFNNRNDVFSLIKDEFFIPRGGQKAKHILVKRNGAKSPHSGYIYKDTGLLFLFSTGTQYPSEKALSPFHIYAIQKHHGNFSDAAKDLYQQGYGDRVMKKVAAIKTTLPIVDEETLKNIEFPIDIFPPKIQSYLLECSNTLGDIIDYTGCALLWLISLSVGNTFNIEVKSGWKERATLWISLVGKAGIGKTPSLNRIVAPLKEINQREFKRYIKEYAEYKEFDALSAKEKNGMKLEKPKNTQFISTDITIEALIQLHQESDNSVGVFKDELSGWIKDMNKYRPGSDLEFWLSAWAGESVVLNRITRDSNFIDKPCLPVLGGIQPSIFNTFYTEENKDNGFMDRMLLSFPDFKVNYWNEKEIAKEDILWYNETMIAFFNKIRNSVVRDEEGNIIPYTLQWSVDAKNEWVSIFNEITSKQLSDDENEYLKSMYPKQISYVARFTLILHIFNSFFDTSIPLLEVQKQTVLDAKKLSDYFVGSAKKVRFDNTETSDVANTIKGDTVAEKIASAYQSDANVNRTKLAEKLGVSRMTVSRAIKRIEDEA